MKDLNNENDPVSAELLTAPLADPAWTLLSHENDRLKQELRIWQEQAAGLMNKIKATDRERDVGIKHANWKFFTLLMGPLDALNFAQNSMNKSRDDGHSMADAERINALYEGLQMVFDQWTEVFEQLNIHIINATGVTFDPKYHDVISHIEAPAVSAEQKEGELWIIEIVRCGYKMNDQILRPAQVVVLKVQGEKSTPST